jgi:hypothetical protein
MAAIPPGEQVPYLLEAFHRFLREELRKGLTEALRETAEKEIKRVVDEALSTLETHINTFHDYSINRAFCDVIVRKRKEL